MDKLEGIADTARTFRKMKLLGDCGLAGIAYAAGQAAVQLTPLALGETALVAFAFGVFAVSASTDLMPSKHTNET